MSSRAERMANPEYAAHIQDLIDEAPPLTNEQRDELAPLLHGSIPSQQKHRRTA